MADRKRRGEDAVDGDLGDEVLDDALDDEALTDDDEDDEDDADVVTFGPSSSKAAVATRRTGKTKVAVAEHRLNIFARPGRFIREIIAELRKVIWSTRKELLTYTTVVLIFVAVMMTIVAFADYGFAKVVLWTFGNGKK